MEYVKGDLIRMALSGEFGVIAHGANCFCTMGAGIARQIGEHFPAAREVDSGTRRGDPSKMGGLSYARVKTSTGTELIVANLYTQFRWGPPSPPCDTSEARYAAIGSSLKLLSGIIPQGARVGLPKIGAGLARGDWGKIEEVVKRNLPSATIVVL